MTPLYRLSRVAPLLVASLLGCQDGGTGIAPGIASLSVASTLPEAAVLFAGTGLEITQVRVQVFRPPADLVASGTFPLSADQGTATVNLSVILINSQETLDLQIDYQNSTGRTLFTGSTQVTVAAGSSGQVPSVPTTYVGPGGGVGFIQLSPVTPQLAAGQSVSFTISALDTLQQPMPPESVYVSWSSSDPSAPVNALGVLVAPSSSGSAWVYARTPGTSRAPSGLVDSTLVTYGTGPSGLVILPDSVEKLPGGTQQFTVAAGPAGPYEWLVNGIIGGSTLYGSIDNTGFYTGPRSVPTPPKISICAQVVANPTITGCAVVVIVSTPSSGADMVVFNDMNLFDNTAMSGQTAAENGRLVENLVVFPSTGSRSTGTVVLHSISNGSVCNFSCGGSAFTIMDSVISANGLTPTLDTASATLASIPANVKVLILWQPTVAYSKAQVNNMKLFAGQGGRIIFVGEHSGYYGSGIPIQNQFLLDMGAQMTNVGQLWDAGYTILTQASLRSHQIMTGITQLTIAAASEIVPGPNDFVLFYDTSNTHALAGVAKIDLTPLP